MTESIIDPVNKPVIERVDEIPIIFHKVNQMGIAERIDRFWPTHGNWKGLSYGQLAVLFIVYVINLRTHRLSGMEAWVTTHRYLLEQLTGWTITLKDATDDRLGLLLDALGSDVQQMTAYQIEQGAAIVQAFELPTAVGRFDLTSFNVHHATDQQTEGGILSFGHSKDRRPDLLQFKQSLGTLDPSGVPLLTMTLRGNTADDGQYVPAWQQMVETLQKREFVFVGDCKMGSLENRAKIAAAGGIYLCPLPMTGQVPHQLNDWIKALPAPLEDVYLEGKKEGQFRKIGQGFEVEKTMIRQDENETFEWKERWLVIHSDHHAKKQKAGFLNRLEKVEKAVKSSSPKPTESLADWAIRLNKMLEEQGMSEFLTVEVKETTRTKKRYRQRGRPTADTPYCWETESEWSCRIQRQAAAIEAHQNGLGWRVYVSNAALNQMTLQQSVKYYRDEYTVEHGFHRLKGGVLPVLPLFVRIDERVKGLLFLLFMCLQVLTLIDFVSRRELAKNGEKLAGLVPGNPKIATTRPSAEKLLQAFGGIHLCVQNYGELVTGYIVEKLSPLQEKILDLLGVPREIYNLTFIKVKVQDGNPQIEPEVNLTVVTT